MSSSRSTRTALEGWHGWDAYAPFYDWENAQTLGRRDVPFWRRLSANVRGRVLELFAAADAAVLASTWETFSHMLVEALSVGTPVIATRVGGVPEIVEDGVNGLLVPAGLLEPITAALESIYANILDRGTLPAPSEAPAKPQPNA